MARGRRVSFALVAVLSVLPIRAPASGEPVVASSHAPRISGPLDPRRPAVERSEPSRLTEPDVPDVVTGAQTHAIYFVPKDRSDEGLDDDNGPLERTIDGLLDWFKQQMGKRPRFDRVSATVYDVSFVRGDKNAAEYTGLGDISTELIAKNFDDADKRYMVFAAMNRDTECGAGYYPLVPELMRQYHVIFLDSSSCDARDWGGGTASSAGRTGTIAVQEWLHNEGVVSPGSPHHCAIYRFHVCTGPLVAQPALDPEEPDAAFPIVTGRLSTKRLDIGRDDYLDHMWPHVPNLRNSPWLE